jgi:hypothetical protein
MTYHFFKSIFKLRLQMLKATTHIKSRLLTQQNVFKLYMHEYQAYDLLKKYQVPLVPVKYHTISELQSQHSLRCTCHSTKSHGSNDQKQAFCRYHHKSTNPRRWQRQRNFQIICTERGRPNSYKAF